MVDGSSSGAKESSHDLCVVPMADEDVGMRHQALSGPYLCLSAQWCERKVQIFVAKVQ